MFMPSHRVVENPIGSIMHALTSQMHGSLWLQPLRAEILSHQHLSQEGPVHRPALSLSHAPLSVCRLGWQTRRSGSLARMGRPAA